jgi:hypothetical protein
LILSFGTFFNEDANIFSRSPKQRKDLFPVYVSAFAKRRGEGATKAGNAAGKNT